MGASYSRAEHYTISSAAPYTSGSGASTNCAATNHHRMDWTEWRNHACGGYHSGADHAKWTDDEGVRLHHEPAPRRGRRATSNDIHHSSRSERPPRCCSFMDDEIVAALGCQKAASFGGQRGRQEADLTDNAATHVAYFDVVGFLDTRGRRAFDGSVRVQSSAYPSLRPRGWSWHSCRAICLRSHDASRLHFRGKAEAFG